MSLVKGDIITVSDLINKIKDTIYPIGSIYISRVSTDPSTLFGGTWVEITDGLLMSKGDIYTSDGGSSTATLTSDNIPIHNHAFTPSGTITSTFIGEESSITASGGTHNHEVLIYNGGKSGIENLYGGSVIASNLATTAPKKYYDQYENGGVIPDPIIEDTSITVSSDITPKGTVSSTFYGTSGLTESQGRGIPFSIMPYYVALYMWKRTS